MDHIIASVDLVVAATASATIVILFDVAALVQSRLLKRAWHALSGMLASCVALLLVHAVFAFSQAPTAAGLVGAAIFLMGVSFIFSIAWLSRRTAHDLIRVEGMARAAYRDPLTGIGNRRLFGENLDVAIREADALGLPTSVIAIDIDHFKAVNDAHGHAVGDEVLKRVAGAIVECTRAGGTGYRIGGEEFAILVPRTDPAFVSALAEQLRREVAALSIETDDRRSLSVTISLGIATLRRGESCPALLRRADQALYGAKRAGRDRFKIAI